jgi:hypothetical protein
MEEMRSRILDERLVAGVVVFARRTPPPWIYAHLVRPDVDT